MGTTSILKTSRNEKRAQETVFLSFRPVLNCVARKGKFEPHKGNVNRVDTRRILRTIFMENLVQNNFRLKIFSQSKYSFTFISRAFRKNLSWRDSNPLKKLSEWIGVGGFQYVSQNTTLNNLQQTPASYLLFLLNFLICLDYQCRYSFFLVLTFFPKTY